MKPGERKLWVKISQDISGCLLILGAALFGWLPGPGGIPLLLGGLGLLAHNHPWAKRLLVSIKNSGLKLNDRVFPRRWTIELFYDALTITAVILAVILLTKYDANLLNSLAFVIFGISIGIILGNRKRLEKIMIIYNNHGKKRKKSDIN